MRIIYECEVCESQYPRQIQALMCEIGSHREEPIPPLEDDEFYSVNHLHVVAGIRNNRVGQWIVRYGRVFENMKDVCNRDDRIWLEVYKPNLLKDGRVRYWIPERDVYAAKKALKLFGGGPGGGFNTLGLGRARVESRQGGAFLVPVSR